MRTIHSADRLKYLRSSVELVYRLFWKDAQGQESNGMNMSISEENQKLSQQLDPQEVGSLARSTPKTKRAAVNCWREHSEKARIDDSRRTTSHCKRKSKIRQNCFKSNAPQNWRGCGRWFWEFYCIMPRVHLFSDPSRFWSKNLGYTSTQRLVSCSWCQNFLSAQHLWNVEIQIPSTSGDKTNARTM